MNFEIYYISKIYILTFITTQNSVKIHPVSSECRGVPIGLTFTQWMIWKPFMTKHRFPRQPHQRFPPFFDIFLYRYCRLLCQISFHLNVSVTKYWRSNLTWRTSFENLLDIALSRNSTYQKGPSCRGMVLLTEICLACRQSLLGHDDTVYLFGTENNFYHSDNILQQILSFVCFRKGRISFWEDKRSTAHELRVFKNQSDC